MACIASRRRKATARHITATLIPAAAAKVFLPVRGLVSYFQGESRSPFQNTTCRDLRGLWRAAAHHVRSHTVPDFCLWLFTHMSCSFNLKLLTCPLATATTASGMSSAVTEDEDDCTVHAPAHVQHQVTPSRPQGFSIHIELGCSGIGFCICEVPPGLAVICQGFQTLMGFTLIWAVNFCGFLQPNEGNSEIKLI